MLNFEGLCNFAILFSKQPGSWGGKGGPYDEIFNEENYLGSPKDFYFSIGFVDSICLKISKKSLIRTKPQQFC